jgi:hypothetical protein
MRSGDQLSTIANTQYRILTDDRAQIHLKGRRIMYGIRASAEDDADDVFVILREFIVRYNLAEGVKFTHPRPINWQVWEPKLRMIIFCCCISE